MMQIIFWVVLIAILLVIIYKSGNHKEGFTKHFSRGAYMRDLNRQMEEKDL